MNHAVRSLLFCAPLLLVACAPSNDTTASAEPNTETYFTYTPKDLASIQPLIEGAEKASTNQVIAWDTRLMDIVRENRMPPAPASRLFAAVAVAQRDALLLGSTRTGFDAVGALVTCDLVPSSCLVMKKFVQNNLHDLSVATIVSAKMHERLEAEKKQVSIPVAPDPQQPGQWWSQTPPQTPEAASWMLWAKDAAITFPPPPTVGSAKDKEEIEGVLTAVKNITPQQRQRVLYWAASQGTETPGGMWLNESHKLYVKHGATLEDMIQVRTALTVALADAFTQCWKAKFTYWTARPFQRDQAIAAVIGVPNFPSYPSGHATISGAAAAVLAAAYPADAADLKAYAQEAADTRVWAGIHFPVDSVEGLKGGNVIGKKVLEDPRFAL